MGSISATSSIMFGSLLNQSNWVAKFGHRQILPGGAMPYKVIRCVLKDPYQDKEVRKQNAWYPQNVDLPPILPKNKKKPYPIPLKKIRKLAKADKELTQKGIEKPLAPPKNGLLVPDLVPVAYEVLEAWKVLIKGLAQLLNVVPVYGCRVYSAPSFT